MDSLKIKYAETGTVTVEEAEPYHYVFQRYKFITPHQNKIIKYNKRDIMTCDEDIRRQAMRGGLNISPKRKKRDVGCNTGIQLSILILRSDEV